MTELGQTTELDVLVPTYNRPAALALTLNSLGDQTRAPFRVVISDQSDEDVSRPAEVRAVLRLLRARGNEVALHRHLPRRGMAEQRQFLLDHARARHALFLDDDVLLDPDLLQRMLDAIRQQRCGFVGSALIGLSFVDDERPEEQAIEFWEGPVLPENLTPRGAEWARHRLHNAANLYHVQRRLGLTPERQRLYKVAWVGGCVLYDVEALRASGGFDFWRALPRDHSGEDVVAQLRVMARYGGCAVIPSGAYHQELPTTIPHREVDAPHALAVG